jgi:hypothetical protein
MRLTVKKRGYLLVLALIFGAVFFTMLTAFTGYVITQGETQESKYFKERALDIAEAGLNYYKWFLAHYPGDTTNGTGLPGPYVIPYEDPEGSVIGEYSLEIASSTLCGDTYAIDIYSTGSTVEEPDLTRTIYARYAKPTVAEYAYIINSNVWAGADRTIVGPYHSNGIIRMDGTNLSTVTSGQENWVCDDDVFPCDPYDDGETVDAVYGNGPNDEFWSFPSVPINFTGISVDLTEMQDKAVNGGGIYIPPSNRRGYRLSFQDDGTVDVYRVTRADSYWGYSTENGWQQEQNVINTNNFYATYTIPSACPLIFVEDAIWIEGEVSGKVTVAAADIDTTGVNPSVVLNGNITYTDTDSGLLAIGEKDVLVGLQVPDNMTVNGIFIAQTGRFGRNHYCQTDCSGTGGNQGLPGTLDPYVFRNTLTVNGTIVSNGREGTKWMNNGVYVSGFNTRNNSYDRDLVSDPPPLTPETSDTYEFIEWREMD